MYRLVKNSVRNVVIKYRRGVIMFCGNCGNKIEGSERFCAKCNSSVSKPLIMEAAPEELSCLSCFATIKEDAKYCGNCGNKIRASRIDSKPITSLINSNIHIRHSFTSRISPILSCLGFICVLAFLVQFFAQLNYEINDKAIHNDRIVSPMIWIIIILLFNIPAFILGVISLRKQKYIITKIGFILSCINFIIFLIGFVVIIIIINILNFY